MVSNDRRQAWCSDVWPVRSMLAVTACFVALSGFAQPQWRHTYGETNSEPNSAHPAEIPSAVAFDNAESVFVAATSNANGPAPRITLLKLSDSGALLWTRHFGGPGNGENRASGLAVDGNGSAYVLGTSTGAGTGNDIVLIKYDPDGNTIWKGLYDHSGGNEEAGAIGLDLQANVYFTGSSEDAHGHSVAVTVKYHSGGKRLWSTTYQGRRPGRNRGQALTVDPFGSAYVTGYTSISSLTDGQGLTVWRTDVLTVKYDAEGRLVWKARHNGTPGLSDEGQAIVADTLGQVYVAAKSLARGDRQDWVTLKYSSAGQLRWAARRNGGNYNGGGTALALDNEGSVYVTGVGSVIKYTDAGRKVWETSLLLGIAGSYVGAPVGLKLDSLGFLYYAMTADFGDSAGRYFHVGQIETVCGEQLWKDLSADNMLHYENVAAMAMAPSGALVVSGSSLVDGGGDLDVDVATVKFQPPDHRDRNRVNVTAVDPIAIEGGRGDAAPGAFAVWRTGPTNSPLVVAYNATGTAKPGLDYLPALQDRPFGIVTIPAGSNFALIPIQPVNDRVWERTETVRFTIARDNDKFSRYLFGPYREAVVRILDNH